MISQNRQMETRAITGNKILVKHRSITGSTFACELSWVRPMILNGTLTPALSRRYAGEGVVKDKGFRQGF